MNTAIIPALPDSIAASLQKNLLDYEIELKFLLLFFERPHAILSTSGLDFINPETVADVKKGRVPRTNLFEDEQNLWPLGVLETDDWAEVLSHCEPHEFKIVVTRDTARHFVSEASTKEVDDILLVTKEGLGLSSEEVEQLFLSNDALSEKQRAAIQYQFILRLELNRFLGVLELTRHHRIQMIWAHQAELSVSRIYAKYLLLSLQSEHKSDFETVLRAALRTVEGAKLLQNVFSVLQLQIRNLAAVPVPDIVNFRRNNQDLLRNFHIFNRGFLEEVQANPDKIATILANYTQQIVKNLNYINNEIALRRRKRGYEFLRQLGGKDFFDAASKCLPWALLSFWFKPWLAPLAAVGGLGLHIAKQMLDERETQLELLFRNSTGYLWKATHDLSGKTKRRTKRRRQ